MGAAISLGNPAYLAFAGTANLQRITANGVPGTLMPPFSQASGGMLTDQQIGVLTQGLASLWSRPSPAAAPSAIGYAAALKANPARGAQLFVSTCSNCHGADGTGSSATETPTGSLVDLAYLALISDQALRSNRRRRRARRGHARLRSGSRASALRSGRHGHRRVARVPTASRRPVNPTPQRPQFPRGDRNE